MIFRFQHHENQLRFVVNSLNMHIRSLELLIDMNKHPRCFLASKECITSCHSQQMEWPVQCKNNKSHPNRAAACNKQLAGGTPAHLVWLHSVETTAYLKMWMFSNTGESHFPRHECPWKRHNGWLTYLSSDLALAEGLMSGESISLLVSPSWTGQHTGVVIMITQLARFLILIGTRHEGHNSSHPTRTQNNVQWKAHQARNKYRPVHTGWKNK